MSPKSRHSTTVYSYSGHRNTVPRHQEIPGSSSVSFTSTCPEPAMSNRHFSLSSSASVPRHQVHASQWNIPSGSLPKGDAFVSLPDYTTLGFSQPEFSGSVMPTVDAMDGAYNVSDEVLSGYAALSAVSPPTSFGEDVIMINDPIFSDFNQDNPLHGDSFPEDWPNRGFTPPPESLLEQAFEAQACQSVQPSPMSGSDECEFLGVSALQAHSGPRHQHRPLRPSSERHESRSSAGDSPCKRLSKDDSADKVRARNDPLYDAKPDDDGFYRCPLVKDSKCSHKPTKQKCIYAKYLDSHLRPYKCKYATKGSDCEETRFSSNACLFRHEREAHGLHNHGVNPYLCDFSECERAKPGNGFPRRWNQRDHMKRVHAWIEEDSQRSSTGDGRGPDSSKRRRGPGGPSSVAMRRSGTSSRAAGAAYSKDGRRAVNTSRPSQVSYSDPMQACNVYAYPAMTMDAIQYSQIQMTTEPGHLQHYVAPYYQAVY